MLSSAVSLAGLAIFALVAIVPVYGEESNGFILLPPTQMAEEERIRSVCQGGSNQYFSVGAMFVAFREALEACVIVSVMINMLNKTGMPHFNKFCWVGVAMGLFISCLCGAGIVAAYYMAQGALLDYRDRAAFSGTFSFIAAIFLTALAVQFLRFKDIEVKYKRKLAEGMKKVKARDDGDVAAEATSKADTAHGALSVQGTQFGNMPPALPVSIEAAPATPLPPSKTSLMAMLRDPDLKGTCIAVFVLCFTAVLREGLECFVFLAAFASHVPPGAVAIAAVVGIVIGTLFGYCFLIMGKCIKDIRYFLISATVFMLFISAGLLALAASAYKTVALIDIGKTDLDFFLTTPLYDIYKDTGDGHQTCGFFAVIRAIIGYTHNPSLLWWLVYLGYWALVIAVLSYRSYKGTLYSKNGLSPVLEDGLGDDDDVESGVGSQSSSIPKKGLTSGLASTDPVQHTLSTGAWYPGAPFASNAYSIPVPNSSQNASFSMSTLPAQDWKTQQPSLHFSNPMPQPPRPPQLHAGGGSYPQFPPSHGPA